MRLFVALQIPSNVRENLTALMALLRSVSKETKDRAVRWERPEKLHITLKFIGEVASEQIGGVREALSGARSSEQVSITFHGLGFFPNEKKPRVFWAGIDASSNLKALASDIEQSLEKRGFPREQREFTPHLTLARFEHGGLDAKLRAAIQENAARDFGSYATNEFHLFESKLRPSGAEYTTLQSFSFVKAEA